MLFNNRSKIRIDTNECKDFLASLYGVLDELFKDVDLDTFPVERVKVPFDLFIIESRMKISIKPVIEWR